MSGLEYPKIDTLYERKPNGKVDVTRLKRLEFDLIKEWQVTEKLNGRNTRVMITPDGEVTYAGRHDEKHLSDQLDQRMIDYLTRIFTPNRMKYVFRSINKEGILEKPEVCMYLEGLGSIMANGSGIYCKGKEISVRLIDCYIKPFWLERNDLEDIAKKFGIKCTLIICTLYKLPRSLKELNLIMLESSMVAFEETGKLVQPEGIVARTSPLLFDRTKRADSEVGERVMWKLKYKDFEKERLKSDIKWMNS